MTHKASTSTRNGARVERAFTLVELLVSVGVVAILLAILAPSLRGALAAAGRAGSLSNLRQLSMLFETYTQSKKGRYPATVHGRSYPVSLDGNIYYGPANRWDSLFAWPGALAEIAPLREVFETLFSPGSPQLRIFKIELGGPYTSYYYANSFVAQPGLWAPGAQPRPEMLTEAHVDQVLHPSAKVLLWDVERPYDRRWLRERLDPDQADTPMLFPDGHAAVKRIADAAEAVRNPLNPRASDATMKLSNTPHGVRGRDY